MPTFDFRATSLRDAGTADSTLPNLPDDFALSELSKHTLHKNNENGKPNVMEAETCSIEDEEKQEKQHKEALLKQQQQFQESLQGLSEEERQVKIQAALNNVTLSKVTKTHLKNAIKKTKVVIQDTDQQTLPDSIVDCFKQLSNEELKDVVDLWFGTPEEKASAIKKYGSSLKYLDTGLVTDMDNLFRNKEEFNDDITLWNTHGVTSSENMFSNAKKFNQELKSEFMTKNVVTVPITPVEENVVDEDGENVKDEDGNDIINVIYPGRSIKNITFADNTGKVFDNAMGLYDNDGKQVQIKASVPSNADELIAEIDAQRLSLGLTKIFSHPFSSSDNGLIAIEEEIGGEKITTIAYNAHYTFSPFPGVVLPINLSFFVHYKGDNLDEPIAQSAEQGGIFGTINFSRWDLSSLTKADYMFQGATTFDFDLRKNETIDFININTNNMFLNATNFINKFGISATPQDEFFTSLTNETIRSTIADYFDADKKADTIEKYGKIKYWLTSGVLDMQELFRAQEQFNEDISEWNVKNVINFKSMLAGAKSFNQSINKWELSTGVTDMSYMFDGAENLDLEIRGWAVPENANIEGLISGATKLQARYGVTEIIDNRFFIHDKADLVAAIDLYEQYAYPVTTVEVTYELVPSGELVKKEKSTTVPADISQFEKVYGPIEELYTTPITDMTGLFQGRPQFNADIGDWDVSNVTNMNAMFSNAAAFNQDIGGWDVSQVTNMQRIFRGAAAFNQDIGQWDVSNVTSMDSMFQDAVAFNQDIGSWDVSQVTNMQRIFFGATAFNQPIGDWDVSNVTTMQGIFFGAAAFNQPIGDWDVSSVTNMYYMFNGAAKFNQPIGDWDVSSVDIMARMFFGTTAFNQPIGDWDVSSVRFFNIMFYESSFNQYIGDWDTSSAISISWMFAYNSSFNQDISTKKVPLLKEDGTVDTNEDGTTKTRLAWDVSNVKHASFTFYNPFESSALDFDIRSWNLDTQLLDSTPDPILHIDLENLAGNPYIDSYGYGYNAEDLDPINGVGESGAAPRSGTVRDLPAHQISHSAYKVDSIDCMLVDKNVVYGEDETTRNVELVLDSFKQGDLGSATTVSFYSKESTDLLTPANGEPSTGGLELSNIEFLELTETEKSLFNGQKAYKLNGTTTLENVSVLYTIWFSLPEQDNGESTIIHQMTFPEYVKEDGDSDGDSDIEDGTVATNGPYTNTLVYKKENIGTASERELLSKNHKDRVITISTNTIKSKQFYYNKVTNKYELVTETIDSKNVAVRVINDDLENNAVGDGLYLESDSAIANPKPDGRQSGLNDLKSLESSDHIALSTDILNLPMTNTNTLKDVIGDSYINMETGENKSTILYNTVFVPKETPLNLYDDKDGAIYDEANNTFTIPSTADTDAAFHHIDATDGFGNPTNPIYPLTFAKGQGNVKFDYEVPLTDDELPVSVPVGISFMLKLSDDSVKTYSQTIGDVTQIGEVTISLSEDLPQESVNEVSMTLTTKDVLVKLSNIRIQDDKYFNDTTDQYFIVNVETVPVEEEKSKYVISTAINEVRDIRDVEKYYLNKEMKRVPVALEATTFLWNYRKDGAPYMVTRQPQVDEDGNVLSVVVKVNSELVLKNVSDVSNYSLNELCSPEPTSAAPDTPSWTRLDENNNLNFLSYAFGWFNDKLIEGDKYFAGYKMETNSYIGLTGETATGYCGSSWVYTRFVSSGFNFQSYRYEQELFNAYTIASTEYLNAFTYTTPERSLLSKSNGLIGDSVLRNQYTTVEQAQLYSEVRGYLTAPYNSTFRERGVLNDWKLGELTNLNQLFYDRSDFNEDLNKWDVSKVTDMSWMFGYCTNFNGDISNWDVSSVETMYTMFYRTDNFNGDISKWNTSSVTDMRYMFAGAFKFNRDISTKVVDEGLDTQYNAWDTSKVTDMYSMLSMSLATEWNGVNVSQYDHGKGDFNNGEEAGLSNKPLLWDTKSCTNMGHLFRQSRRFNQNVSTKDVTVGGKTYTSFNTGNVTSMQRTFAYCEYFNNGDLPGESSKPLLWNTELVTYTDYMFGINQSFVLPYSIREQSPMLNYEKEELELYSTDPDEWARIYDNNGLYTTPYKKPLFRSSGSYNQPYNTGTRVEFGEGENKIAYTPFDVSRVGTMWVMHQNQRFINQPIIFSSSSCNNFYSFLVNCTSFNSRIEITSGDNSDFGALLRNGVSFNQPVDGIDVSKVTNVSSMLKGCTSFNQPVDGLDTGNVITMTDMFNNAKAFNQSIDSLDIGKVIFMSGILRECKSFNQPINLDTKNVQDISSMLKDATSYNHPLTLDLRSATTVASLLEGATSFNHKLVSELVTEDTVIIKNVMSLTEASFGGDASKMLKDCTSYNQPLDDFDFDKVKNMASFLEGATYFNKDIENINVDNVTDMTAMLKGCKMFNQQLDDLKSSNVETMESLLEGATSFNKPIENMNTSNVTNMKNMLKGASSFNKPLTKLNLTNVTTLEGFLENTVSYNKRLIFSDSDKLNTAAVTSMKNMLKGATNFNQDVEDLSTDNVESMESMFEDAINFNKSIAGLPGTSTTNVKQLLKGATSYNKSLEGLDTTNLTDVEGLLEDAISFNQPFELNYPNTYSLNRILKGATAFNSELSKLKMKVFNDSGTRSVLTDPSIIIDQLIDNDRPLGEYGFTEESRDVYRAIGANVTAEQGASNEFSVCNSRLLISGKANDRTTCTISYRVEQYYDYVSVDLHKVNGLNADKQIDVNTIIESTTSILSVSSDSLPAVTQSLDIDQTPNYDYILEVRFTKDQAYDADGYQAGGDLVEVKDIKLNGLINKNIVFEPEEQTIDNLLEGATSFNKPFQHLDTSSVGSMKGLFKDATSFNQELAYLDVSKVKDMSNMFENATDFTGAGIRLHADKNLRFWSTKKGCNFTDMFKGAIKHHENFFPTDPGYTEDKNTPTESFFNQDRPCFDSSTKILAIKDGKEEYVSIGLLKEGDLVQTYKHGPQPIKYIGSTRITLNGPGDDYTLKMYRMKKTGEMIDDLLVTGRHAMLVDDWSSHYCKNRHSEVSKEKIDDKYMLGAAFSKLFTPEKQKKSYDIFHLEIDGENQRYGLYANGVLAESLQKGSRDKLLKNESSEAKLNISVSGLKSSNLYKIVNK